MNNEQRLKTEARVIRRYLKTLVDAGYELQVDDGGDNAIPWTRNAGVALDDVTAVDMALVYVRKAEGERTSFLQFVRGNAPGEVLCDYGMSLEEAIAEPNAYAERWT